MSDERFGRWTTLLAVGKPYRLLCRCDCGVEKVVSRYHLESGMSKSCGCLKREMSAARKPQRSHGEAANASRSPEYIVWSGMKRRCQNENAPNWELYGGRGVRVCARWQAYEAFLEDMGRRPSPKHTLDRIDPDGDYAPENCRWATWMTQATNKRTSKLEPHEPEQIRWLVEAGYKRSEVAAMFGISASFISGIVTGKSYCNAAEDMLQATAKYYEGR